MSIVMVSNKTKEEILAGIKALLVAEASTPENLKAVKTAAVDVVKHCQEQAAKIAEIRVKVESMEDFDQEEKEALIATRLKKAGLTVEQEVVPTVEEVEKFKLSQLVAESAVLSMYEKWATLFGLESKKAVGRPTTGGDKVESKFDGHWSRELTNGALCVNFRLLTDEQKAKYELKNANQWVVMVGEKTQVCEASAPNNLIMVAKLLLGQSVASGVNNSVWNEGKELTAAQIASF